jgi:hypothetical protein
MLKTDWRSFKISADQTHHVADGQPAYEARFLTVLKFHNPGLAPVQDLSGSYHIDETGNPAYANRFSRTFGFYDGLAAVQSADGWHHILPDGTELYLERYAWCGNFQQHHCPVRDFEGRFFHLTLEGKRAYITDYKYAGDFHDGYAVVQDDDGLHTHIDFHGSLLNKKKFLDLDVFHKGFARAKDAKGWFHIDTRGAALYTDRYKNIEPFYNGIARVETANGALFLINESGETVAILREPLEDEFHQVSAELVSYWRFYTLDTACQLKIFDQLPGSTDSLSKKTETPHDSIEKLLRALCEMGFVSKSDQWQLSNKGAFLTSGHPFSLLPAQKLWKDEHLHSWQKLLYSLKAKTPSFDHLFEKSWFDYLKNNEEKTTLYHQAISTYARRDYKAASLRLDLTNHHSIVDIGGSSGTLMMELLKANPHLQGIILDLPNVISLIQIPPDMEGRLKLLPANFFADWPLFKADCAILARVLHDWSDSSCVEILKKVKNVLSNTPTHRLYIIENLLDSKSFSGSLLDLNMLVMTEGKERTLDCFEKILAEAGFILEKTCPLNEVTTILIAKRAL